MKELIIKEIKKSIEVKTSVLNKNTIIAVLVDEIMSKSKSIHNFDEFIHYFED